jgi:hypothetical protein
VRVLDLFAGLGGWSAPFLERGHEVYRIDNDPRFEVESHADILTLAAADLPWRPDIILASPPCESFSVLTIGRNWAPGRVPKTDGARLAIALVEATRRLIDDLRPAYFVVENPRAMLRTLPMLADLERRTVTYCQYGEPFMKPTDLWGGFPPSLVTRRMCRPRQDCHVSSPRGSTTGIQGDGVAKVKCPRCRERFLATIPDCPSCGKPYKATRTGSLENVKRQSREHFGTSYMARLAALRAVIPHQLALDVCLAAERDLAAGAKPIPTMLWGVA